MKKNSLYFGIALCIGLLGGYLLFGTSANKKTAHNHTETVAAHKMWTCSMHPQIMKSEPGDCPICGMELIPAESGAEGLAANEFKLTQNAMALANVETSIVGSSTMDDTAIRLSGKIAENEDSNAVQVSYFSGRIERLNVSSTGEKIHKGQLLATMYSPELYAAQQELITAASLKKTQPALYKAVKNKLKLWKLSEKQINSIETSGKVKQNFPVYATVSGTVTEKLAAQGDYIKQGQPLLKIAKLTTVWANFDVYENQLNLFKKGQEVIITTDAYPAKEFKGSVSFIDPILDTQTRTVKLRVVLNNTNTIFKPGMFVSGKVVGVSSTKKQTLSIPASAILWTGKRSVVYVKTSPTEPIFEMQEVTLGSAIGANYEVVSGLKNGDEIVTNGTFTIDAAAQLQGKKSMMNRQDTSATATKNTNAAKTNKRIEVATKFKEQLKTVFENYSTLKDALVSDDSNKAKEAAQKVVASLSKVNMELLSNKNAHIRWMKLENEMKTAATSIVANTAIKEQRAYFEQVSLPLTTAIELFGINQKVFNQFCPMANNNKGAYWLSKDKKVLNPYFGKAMHSCGKVATTIQ